MAHPSDVFNNSEGWFKIKAFLYGTEETKDVKVFKALYKPAGCLVQLWAWDKSAKVFCDRSGSPWDDLDRRPSHSDKCTALKREVLRQTFFSGFYKSREIKKIHKQFYKLLKLVA